MNEQAILEIMRSYFPGEPAGDPGTFGEKFPRSMMKESLDVVNFLVFLEDKTGCHIDITEVGPAMLDKNFNQLAADLAARLKA
jgi:hypothetical protein